MTERHNTPHRDLYSVALFSIVVLVLLLKKQHSLFIYCSYTELPRTEQACRGRAREMPSRLFHFWSATASEVIPMNVTLCVLRKRAPYIAYLTRCRQGLQTAQAHLERLLQRVLKDKEVANRYFTTVCVRLLLEHMESKMLEFIKGIFTFQQHSFNIIINSF